MLEDMAFYDEFSFDSVLPKRFIAAISEMVLAFALLAQQCKKDYIEFDRPQNSYKQAKIRKVKKVGNNNYTITQSQSKVVPKKSDSMSNKTRKPPTNSMPHRNESIVATKSKIPKEKKCLR